MQKIMYMYIEQPESHEMDDTYSLIHSQVSNLNLNLNRTKTPATATRYPILGI